MYFRYTDDKTLAERFNKNGKRGFNYIKKYNSSIYAKIIRLYYKYIHKYFTTEYNIPSEEIIKAIDKYNEVTKKLDKDTENKIDNILNPKKIYVNDNNESTKGNNNNTFNEGKHYKNIEKVLKIIKEKTNGYIDYCIILDIKKSNFRSINKINKKKNYSLNNQSGGGFFSIIMKLIGCITGIYVILFLLYLPFRMKYYNKKERDIKLNKKINELEEILFHYPRIYLVKNCLPHSFNQYQEKLLHYDSNAENNINVQGIDIIQDIIKAELKLLFLKNYKLNIFVRYNSNYMKKCFIKDIWTQNKQNFLDKISELSQDSDLQNVIRKKLNYIGRKDGKWYEEFKNNIQFINSPRGSPDKQKWLEFANWWKRYWPYGHNLDEMVKTYQNL
jgi:hypothetical protein